MDDNDRKMELGVAVIIVSHQSSGELEHCLDALRDARSVVGIWVVDNASTDGSIAIAGRYEEVSIISAGTNTGFAGGCNIGYQHLDPRVAFVAFMNPDVRVAPDCLEHACTLMEANPQLGGIAPLLVRQDGETVDSAGQVFRPLNLEVQDRGYGRRLDEMNLDHTTVVAACGALAIFRRTALEAIAGPDGPFDSSFFCFWEDFELGWRLSNAGWPILFAPEARAIHGRGAGASPGSGPLRWRRPPELEACILTNRWTTLLRHLHVLDLLVRLPLLLVWDSTLVVAGIVRRPRLAKYILKRLPLIARARALRGANRPRLNNILSRDH